MTQQSTAEQAVIPCQVLNGEGSGRTTALPTEMQQAAAARSLPIRHIRIRAFITADDDGTHSAMVDHPDKAKDQWGYKYRIEVEDITKLVGGATKVFSAAGIQLHFDPATDVEIRHETLLNRDSVPPEGSTSWARNRLAKEHRGTLVVFFRYGWQGWSGSTVDFVVMPSIWDAQPKGLSFLAHELGHYFHLDHTFVDIGDIPSAALTIKNYVEDMARAQHHGQLPDLIPTALLNKGLEILDNDRGTVSDTPAELLGEMFNDVCDPNESAAKVPVTFATGQSKSYPLQPDRDNIMNYTEKDCRGIPPHFSQQQLARMRNAVDAGNRKHLWQPVGGGPTPFAASAVASNGDVHLFALDRHDGLWHTLRAPNGDWPVPWGDVQQAIRDHGHPDVGPTKSVACGVASNGDVHVLALDQHDGLWHTVRAANGDWPVPWGDVQQAIRNQGHPDVGPTRFVACATAPNDDLHVFVLDQHDGLWHTSRRPNGDWPFGWGDVQQAIRNQNHPHVGPTKAVACATAANGDVHVFVIDQLDGLWHTLRLANGDWPVPWGDVRAIVP